jgi:hypothetical protein
MIKKKQIGPSLRGSQNIMGAEPSEHADFTLHLEGKAIAFRDPGMGDAGCSEKALVSCQLSFEVGLEAYDNPL